MLKPRTVASLLLASLFLFAGVALADDEPGQDDLDKATELKITASFILTSRTTGISTTIIARFWEA